MYTHSRASRKLYTARDGRSRRATRAGRCTEASDSNRTRQHADRRADIPRYGAGRTQIRPPSECNSAAISLQQRRDTSRAEDGKPSGTRARYLLLLWPSGTATMLTASHSRRAVPSDGRKRVVTSSRARCQFRERSSHLHAGRSSMRIKRSVSSSRVRVLVLACTLARPTTSALKQPKLKRISFRCQEQAVPGASYDHMRVLLF
jgi:hypothetical protein